MKSRLLKHLKATRPLPSEAHIDAHAIQRMVLALSIKNPHVHMNAVQALLTAGAPAVKPLIRALASSDPQVWRLASAILVKIGDAAVPDLLAALEQEHETLRMLAAAVLFKIGKPAPYEPGWERMRHEYSKLLAHQQTGPVHMR